MIVTVAGAKGGVGTSSVAAAFAAIAAADGAPVELVSHDPATMAALLGLPEPGNVTASLRLHDRPTVEGTSADLVIVDQGLAPDRVPVDMLVLRNDFLSLKRAAALPTPLRSYVLVEEPDRALGPDDAAAALGTPVLVIPCDPKVARAIDGGILIGRLPSLRSLRSLTLEEAGS